MLRVHRQPGDGWVDCACGHQHWGLNGAAGLLLWRTGVRGPQLVLQHRALWSHHGGTWGLPGGAIRDGESALHGAVREAAEEAGVEPGLLHVRASRALLHPDWAYTTVVAETTGPFEPRVGDPESLEMRWVDLAAHRRASPAARLRRRPAGAAHHAAPPRARRRRGQRRRFPTRRLVGGPARGHRAPARPPRHAGAPWAGRGGRRAGRRPVVPRGRARHRGRRARRRAGRRRAGGQPPRAAGTTPSSPRWPRCSTATPTPPRTSP